MKVITHSGHFQPDDVFAIAALSLMLGDFELVRSRDPEVIKTGDYVVDVGREYDPEKNRFDHHQAGGAGTRKNGVSYSSIGLIWKHYGIQLSGSEEVASRIDEKLIQPLDLNDNGQTFFTADAVYPYLVDDALYAFQPTWKEGDVFDERFGEAVEIAKKILAREIKRTREELEARELVEALYQAMPDKKLLVMDQNYPAGDLFETHPEILFTVKPDATNATWKVTAVRENKHDFKNRKDLPAAWAGKTDQDLQELTGVADATFCHNARFVAAAKSKEGAITLAKLALES
ncbi:MAG: MYG1 family protein [Candidatus Sungbacteria bacterium]|uniref:MYG1 family protein n=1 Tax=Candidatus Sungiibacteriota bacterium TaxID=2750080 RepID=A0A9D6LMU4_9BACT|nr:MYG1 family protein [Candidatus Sungbacteria bacterium]